MASSAAHETLRELAQLRERSSRALVAYSDGKDARCVMDLATRSFDHVEGFFMYFVPGLECCEVMLEAAQRRWGVKIHQYPHWATSAFLREGLYCPVRTRREVPEWKLANVYALAMHETGIPIILTGAKKSDGVWRRWAMKSARKDQVHEPIKNWSKFDVLAYLKARSIPRPNVSDERASGIGLADDALLWLHDLFPDDFRKVCQYFPYAEAVVWRREFYGEGARFQPRDESGRNRAGEVVDRARPAGLRDGEAASVRAEEGAVQSTGDDRRGEAEAQGGAEAQ